MGHKQVFWDALSLRNEKALEQLKLMIAGRKVSATQNLLVNNHEFHRLLTEGVDVSYRVKGQIKHDKVWLVDFHNPDANDWLAVNQLTIIDHNVKTQVKTNRRPDIILFINGLPLVVIELKNAADEQAAGVRRLQR